MKYLQQQIIVIFIFYQLHGYNPYLSLTLISDLCIQSIWHYGKETCIIPLNSTSLAKKVEDMIYTLILVFRNRSVVIYYANSLYDASFFFLNGLKIGLN